MFYSDYLWQNRTKKAGLRSFWAHFDNASCYKYSENMQLAAILQAL